MNRIKRPYLAAGVAAILVLAGIGAGAGMAIAGGGDDDQPLTGPALEQATAAALELHPDGTVIETEVGDDGAAYGVEVRLDDGSVVEVSLDGAFKVVSEEADDDGPNDEDGADDD
jgi:hypothetical protein